MVTKKTTASDEADRDAVRYVAPKATAASCKQLLQDAREGAGGKSLVHCLFSGLVLVVPGGDHELGDELLALLNGRKEKG